MNASPDPARSAPVRLRRVEREDLPVLFEHQNDPDAYQMAAVHPRDEASFHERWAQTLADPQITARAITAAGVLVGTINCFPVEDEVHVGYWIAQSHWGRGIATQALRLILAEVATRPIHARVAEHNAGSIRVLLRCGFEITGHKHSPATDRFMACEEALFVLAS